VRETGAVRGAGLLVIGSGPAGLAAVRSFRERDPVTSVIMVTADWHPPYARPPLTKDFARGDSGLDDLWLTEDGWFDDQRVELRTGARVTGLDPSRRTVRLADDTELAYRDLVLATGSRPVPLPVPGGNHPAIVYLRDLDSGQRLRGLGERRCRVAVVGSGFIGCEAAASLASSGVDVVLISGEEVPHAARLDEDAGREIHRWLTDAGVETQLGVTVERIDRVSETFELGLDDGRSVSVDAVVAGSGARPDLTLAESAGIVIENGGIRVDASMRTSASHVLAAGDIVFAEHPVAGRPLRVEHWGDADTQGTVAGAVAAGGDDRWSDPPGFWSTIGDRTLKYTAWGDGHDTSDFDGDEASWTVTYRRDGEIVGVLTHEDDAAYERGQELLRRRAGSS